MVADDTYVLTSVTLPPDLGPQPEPAAVSAHLGFGPDDIDMDFGVVAISPEAGLFAIRLRHALIDANPDLTEFSDPEIAPFGPSDPD